MPFDENIEWTVIDIFGIPVETIGFKDFYTDGDLLYGLAQPRQLLRGQLNAFPNNERVCIMDQLSPWPVVPPPAPENINANAYNQAQSEFYATEVNNNMQMHQYVLDNQHDGVQNAIASGNRYTGNFVYACSITPEGNEPMSNYELARQSMNGFVSRKCKGGIFSNTKNQKHIHFCIAGIDMEQVISKKGERIINTDDGEIGTKKSAFYTSKELRYVYRNKEHPNFQKNIQFWDYSAKVIRLFTKYKENNETIENFIMRFILSRDPSYPRFAPCPPPWVTNPGLWEGGVLRRYLPESISKRLPTSLVGYMPKYNSSAISTYTRNEQGVKVGR